MKKLRTKKAPQAVAQPTKPPERVRPPRERPKLRWESMWHGVENTSMFVHNVAAWGAAGDPKIPTFQRGLVWGAERRPTARRLDRPSASDRHARPQGADATR